MDSPEPDKAEVRNDLIYEVLKQVRDKVANVELVGKLKTEMQAFRGHLISLQTDLHNIYSILARHDVRLDRVEKRLGLIELAL